MIINAKITWQVADDGNTLARINLQRQDGIVTYQNSELAKKAIATLNGIFQKCSFDSSLFIM
ncbi:hypothetical protein DPMN_177624 [Dreissena polymorpha]|uniref:Uncharacterized protein n=1 Tax=Dreissena polymorpha TaxID=45954 RepID=A0A9D4EDD2_DREPO|nr:hypothetical protein DPMN_177624 [Dreissena polymorpha]